MAKRRPKNPDKVTTTLRYRVKDASELTRLDTLARSVNCVWNYCNDTSFNAIRNHGKWLSAIDLKNLTSGSAKELGISSVTVQAICEEYVIRRIQFKKRKLRWRTSRGSKRSLGWIPFKANSIQINGDRITYLGHDYKIWLSRPIDGRVLSGSFSQDAQGHWYVNIACEVAKIDIKHSEFRQLEEKLAKAQRANKKKQAKKIHARIRNKRRDFLQKDL